MARRNASVRKSANDAAFQGESPFVSMYSQQFGDPGSKAATKNKNQRNSNFTPQKYGHQTISQKYQEFTPDGKLQKQDNGSQQYLGVYSQRRFGEYIPTEAGTSADHGNMNKSYDHGMNTFTSGFSGAYSMASGSQSVGRRNRCSDRFVKYPYPKVVMSNYQKEYPSKMQQAHILQEKDAFNIEKEHKIINPHKMELSTTNKTYYKPFQVKPASREMRLIEKNDAPCQQKSQYQAEYPNWKNGSNDIYHEKHPQYPFYSLPFKGNSSYQNSFTDEKMRELRRQQELISQLGASANTLKVNHYQPMQFDFETMNQKLYKPFKLANRPTTSKPQIVTVKTNAFPQHFDTFNKKEFVKHQHRVPEVDLIPYP